MPWFEIISGGIVLLLTVLGFNQILKHGEERRRRKEAEDEKDAVLKRERQGNAADLTDDQHDNFIDRL